MLSLLVLGAAASGHGSELKRGGCPGRAPGRGGCDDGNGGD